MVNWDSAGRSSVPKKMALAGAVRVSPGGSSLPPPVARPTLTSRSQDKQSLEDACDEELAIEKKQACTSPFWRVLL